jgi:indolepyruvate decarboxylase
MTETLATALLQALKARGADRVFGIPGDFVLPFFRVVEQSGILPWHTLSHEPGVGYAADAAARINGSLGVAVITYGAGALNMVNAVAQAYAEKSPLVVISGAPGTGEGKLGLNLHHQVKTLDSQLQIYRELTCAQAVLNDPGTAHEEIARVLDAAEDYARPVYIEIPRDLVAAPCAPVPPREPGRPDREAARACAREILGRLRSAADPAVLVGVEVRRYGLEDKVAELCRKLGLPVATSFMGRGLLARQDVPLRGAYLGSAGSETAARCVEGSDCLLMLGVILSDTNFGVSGRNIDLRGAIQAIDRQVAFRHHTYPDVTLEALIDALTEMAEPVRRAERPNDAPAYPRGLPDDATPLAPSHIAMAVNDLFDAHGRLPIATDIGDCLFTGLEIMDTEFVAPGYYASMGIGVPGGMAIAATMERRPIILVGDGAFQMTGWELGNCRKYGWAPIVIVFNNLSWEMLRVFQPGPAYHDLDDWHYAEIAPHLGGHGVRVQTCAELKQAMAEAYDDDSRFRLIEVMLPRGQTSQTLSNFVGAVREMSALKGE